MSPKEQDEFDRAWGLGEHSNAHLNTERRQGLVGEGSLTDGSSTDGKIVGLCPGCNQAIRKHRTAHGDELRHLHNNHVRCFGRTAGIEPEDAVKGVEVAADAGKAIGQEFHDLVGDRGDDWAYRAESALQAFADYLGRPDANNPTGRGPDEYRARTWDSYLTTRPMQSADDRGVNTPVLPQEPLKTRNINTPTPGLRGHEHDLNRDEEEDDEE